MADRVLKVDPRPNCRAVELVVDGEPVTVYARGTGTELTDRDRAALIEFARELRRRGPRAAKPETGDA